MKFTVTWNVGNQLKFKDFKNYESAKKFADKKVLTNPTTCIIIDDETTTKIEDIKRSERKWLSKN